MQKSIEERLLDLERRFYPIENVLYNIMKDEIEKEKEKQIDEYGREYCIEVTLETDRGVHPPKRFSVKAYSEAQAFFFCNRDIIYPNMNRLKEEGKFKWFKVKHKQCV